MGPSAGGGERTAPWAWPVILLSVAAIGWSDALFERLAGEGGETAPEAPAAAVARAGELAVLKMQAQFLIAAEGVDTAGARRNLRQLRRSSRSEHEALAVALLEGFLKQGDEGGGVALEPPAALGEDSEWRELLLRAWSEGIGEEDRERLRGRVGWFAELAPGPGPAPPPGAEAIRQRAALVALGGVLVTFGILGGVALGGVLLLVHVRGLSSGRRRHAFDPAARPAGVLLECFALYLGLTALGGLAGGALGAAWPGVAGSVAGLVLPFWWAQARGIAWANLRRALGLHAGEGWGREAAAGAVGYLGVMAIASVGIFVTLGLSLLMDLAGGAGGGGEGAAPGGGAGPEVHPAVGWMYAGGTWERVFILLLAVVAAPVIEEIFFRGALQRWLRGRMRFFGAAFLTGLIFAALHPQGWMGIPALAAIGIGFSLLREWRDSLVAPMVAHAINNALIVGLLWVVL